MLPERAKLILRLTEAQADDLRKVVKARGQTQQAFVLAAVVEAVERAKAEIKQRALERESERRPRAPGGLGVRASGLRVRAASEAPAEQAATAGRRDAEAGSLDEALTQFVAGARGEEEREARERAAAHVRQVARSGGGLNRDAPPREGGADQDGGAQASATRLAALLSDMFGGKKL